MLLLCTTTLDPTLIQINLGVLLNYSIYHLSILASSKNDSFPLKYKHIQASAP